MIKILLGMSRPTSGHARVFGLAADSPATSVAIRRRTGFVSEEKDLYDLMTVEQIIRFTASFYAGWRKHLEHRYLRSFELPLDRKVRPEYLGPDPRVSARGESAADGAPGTRRPERKRRPGPGDRGIGGRRARFELNGLFRVMSASTYFAAGSIPWTGLLISTTMSAAMLYGASVNVARQDF